MSKPRNPLIPYVLNSDYEDEVLMVWDSLTKNKENILSSDIVLETGVQASKVFQVLNAMTNASIVIREDVKGEKHKVYSIAKSVDAISWAMALELGIPVASLSKNITLKETDLAIYDESEDKDVSYFVEAVKEKNKLEKEKKKKELLEDKAQSLVATSEVSKILDDLDFLFHTLSANDPMANYVVETRNAFIQAQKTLNKHLESKYLIKS